MADKNLFKDLLGALKNATSTVFEKHKESNAVIFIRDSIKRTENILKTIDKMLKKRNIDVGAMADNVKGKGKDLYDQATAMYNEGKEKGFLATAKAKAANVKTKIGEAFASDSERSNGPPGIFSKMKEFVGDSFMSAVGKSGLGKTMTGKVTASFDPVDPDSIIVDFEQAKTKNKLSLKDYGKLKKFLALYTTVTLVENFDSDEEKKEETESKLKEEGEQLALKGTKKENYFKKLIDKFGSRTEAEAAETEANNNKAEEKAEKKQSIFSKMFGKSKDRDEKRKKEIEDEKKAVQENSKKKDKDSWFGKIIGAIGAVGGFIGKALGSLGGFMLKGFTNSIGFLGGFVVKGLGKTFMSIVPALSSSIARITSKLVGGGLKAAGSLAWEGAKAAGRAILPAAGGALQLAGRAALTLATGPVGWVVAAATVAYAGYKLYKYLKRNDVADDLPGKLTRLRLLMYGFNDAKKEHYSKVFDLEMLMKDYVKFKDYKVVVDKLTKDDIDKILDIFKVSRDEKDKYAVLNTWFVKRFMPAYKSFMQAMWSVNNSIYLDEIDKFKPVDFYNFVTHLSIPTVIYDIEQVPTFDDTRVYHSKTQVDEMLINVTNMAKEQANMKDSNAAKKVAEENKRAKNAAAQKQQPEQKKAEEAKATVPPPKQPPPEQAPGDSDSPPGKEKSEGEKTEVKAAAKLSKASGEIYPGSTSLEGISTALKKEKIYNLDPNVRELFTGMAKEYNALTGKTIPVNEAFRSYDDQAALYAKNPGKAAKPGNSTHEFGLALDIASKTADELDKLGLMRKYGFTRPIGGEKWHIEPIGVSVNPNLAKKDQNYRFTAIQTSVGRGGDGYGALDNSVLKKRDTNYQLSIYNKAGGETIDPAKAVKGNKDNLTPKPEMSGKSEDKPKITGQTSPTGNKPNADAKGAMGLPANPDAESKPSTNPSDKPLEKSENVAQPSPNTDVGKFADLGPQAAIKQAAKMTGMNEQTMLAYAQMESSGKGGSIKNKNSSATGLFQILKGTWDALVKKYGPKYGLPADAKPDNNYYNALMAMEYAKENLASLKDYQSAGIDEATAIYLAHHYGPGGARKIIDFLKKDPNTPMKNAVPDNVYKANSAAIGDNTVQGYVQKVSGKIAAAGGSSNAGTSASGSKSIEQVDAPKPADNNTAIASKDSGFQKAVLKSEPTPASPYKTVNTASAATAPSQAPAPQQSSIMNPKNAESLMTEQLNALNLIAKILTSIDGKFDGDTFKQLAASKSQTPSPAAPDKSIPKGSVSLSRKPIEA